MRNIIAIGLIVVACIIPFLKPGSPSPKPEPDPVVPVVPATDTEVWKAILLGMSDMIEADGKTQSPVFKTLSDVEQYRNAVVSVPIRGIDGGQRVSGLLGPKLSAIASPVLDAESRALVVAAFRDVAKAL
jgi:hypothetical protein